MLMLVGLCVVSAFCAIPQGPTTWFLTLLTYYLTVLYSRRRRRLPAALEKCRFIRLGFLRKLKAAGGRIKRCQELPEDAFGDVGLASMLLTTSHRWLHRYTCDVIDEQNPDGVRLTSMLWRISLTVPESLAGLMGNGFCSGISKLINGMTIGGSDLILFFDFMGLPQIGQLPDGSLIERTPDETTLFMEALPAMGAMYTMYQVLVIPEVSGDVHPYFSSGWCFSEFCSALLSQKMELLSSKAIAEYTEWLAKEADTDSEHLSLETLNELNSGTLSNQGMTQFLAVFEADLARKKLFNNDDRPTIAGIVQGYLLIRLLCDAVRNQNETDVQKYLTQLVQKKLKKTLSQAVDESLDTLLHVAARLPSKAITLALLDTGADPNVQNLAGDTPAQFYIFPRFGTQASLIREWQNSPPEGYSSVTASA